MFKMNNADKLQYIEDEIAEWEYEKEALLSRILDIDEKIEELKEEQLGYWQEERKWENMEYERSV